MRHNHAIATAVPIAMPTTAPGLAVTPGRPSSSCRQPSSHCRGAARDVTVCAVAPYLAAREARAVPAAASVRSRTGLDPTMTVAIASIRPTPMLTQHASARRANAVTPADRRRVVRCEDQRREPQRDRQPVGLCHEPVELHRRRGDEEEQRVRAGADRQPRTGASGEEARHHERREQRGGRHHPSLGQQVGQRMANRHGDERDQHAEAILSPEERRPSLRADQHGQQRVGMLKLMERPEAHPRGQAGDQDRHDEPRVAEWIRQRGCCTTRLSREKTAEFAETLRNVFSAVFAISAVFSYS